MMVGGKIILPRVVRVFAIALILYVKVGVEWPSVSVDDNSNDCIPGL